MARASSSWCRSPTSPRRPAGTERDLQSGAHRSRAVLRRHEQRRLRRRGEWAGTRLHSQLRDKQRNARRAAPARRPADRHGVHRRSRLRKPLGSVLRERRQRLHGRHHREGRLRRAGSAAKRRRHEEAEPGRHLCGSPLERRGSLMAEHRREYLDLDRKHVGSSGRRPAGAHHELERQDVRDQLQQPH